MKTLNSINHLKHFPPIAMTLGNFDGFHHGHLTVLKKLVRFSKKSNCASVVFSFNNHPKLNNQEFLGLIYPTATKNLIFSNLGIDYVVYLNFFTIKKLDYQEFLNKILKNTEIKGFIASDKLSFGCNKNGTPEKIKNFFQINSSKLNKPFIQFISSKTIIPATIPTPTTSPNSSPSSAKWSSSLIRSWLKKGNFESANNATLLPFHLAGKIAKGKQLGQTINFPTLNFHYPNLVKIPDGNYITLTLLDGKVYRSITFVGQPFPGDDNPVLNSKKIHKVDKTKVNLLKFTTVETHLLKFSQSVYNYPVVVFFLHYLEAPVKTKSLLEVQGIVEKQKKIAMNYFKTNFKEKEKITKKIRQLWKQIF